MRSYYQELPRPPLTMRHGFAAGGLPATAPPRLTEHAKSLHAEHVELGVTAGYDVSRQQKRLIPHQKEIATKERVKALTESGLYSTSVKKINAREIARKQALLEQAKEAKRIKEERR